MDNQYETIRIDKADGITTLMFNRPEKKNALTRDMYEALSDGVNAAAADPEAAGEAGA